MEGNSKVVGSENESDSGSMEDILQLNNTSPFAENMMKIRFRSSYRIRKLKNKGARLILVWNCLVISVFYYLTMYPVVFHPTSFNIFSIT